MQPMQKRPDGPQASGQSQERGIHELKSMEAYEYKFYGR